MKMTNTIIVKGFIYDLNCVISSFEEFQATFEDTIEGIMEIFLYLSELKFYVCSHIEQELRLLEF